MITSHPAASAWLDRVERLASDLAPARRRELLADLGDHLDQALGAEPTDQQVQAALARLGDPVDIVDAAHDDDPGTTAPPATPQPPPPTGTADPGAPSGWLTGVEVAVLAGLAISGLIAPLFIVSVPIWIVAVVLLFARTRWRGVEQLVALAVPLGFAVTLGLGLLAFTTESYMCEGYEVDGVLTETCTDGSGNEVDPDDLDGVNPWAAAVLAVPPLASTVGMVWMARRVRGRPV